jgi:hypothetical protein
MQFGRRLGAQAAVDRDGGVPRALAVTQLGEPVCVGMVVDKPVETLFAAVTAVTFNSGIPVFDVAAGGAETELPAPGSPHWAGSAAVFPAVYVRQGGSGETKDLDVTVEWSQAGHDGAATLKGVSADASIAIEGSFTISGQRGSAVAKCKFTAKPDKVTHLGAGIGFEWKVTAGADTVAATGGSPLKLFFVDAKPKPIAWAFANPYKAHYLKVIEWTTTWAAGQQGEAAVRAAIWDKFSDGSAARVPHVTGFSYWKTPGCVQDLRTLVRPDGDAVRKGWSCRAIAHTFMECLALHGITCKEVIPVTAPGTRMFLVHNWNSPATPLPNWAGVPSVYYAGSWAHTASPPLNVAVATGLFQVTAAGVTTSTPLAIDMLKRPGVVAQGQRLAPLGFSNHWIVELDGQLYDSSYGAIHANSMTTYAHDSLGGWLVDVLADPGAGAPTGFGAVIAWLVNLFSSSSAAAPTSGEAWCSQAIASHTLQRNDGSHN